MVVVAVVWGRGGVQLGWQYGLTELGNRYVIKTYKRGAIKGSVSKDSVVVVVIISVTGVSRFATDDLAIDGPKTIHECDADETTC